MLPLITRRSSTRRAPGWFCGSRGASTAHASSSNPYRPVMTLSSKAFPLGSHDTHHRKMLIEFRAQANQLVVDRGSPWCAPVA